MVIKCHPVVQAERHNWRRDRDSHRNRNYVVVRHYRAIFILHKSNLLQVLHEMDNGPDGRKLMKRLVR
jgi:hypothetical protein